jgi:hypothetical protein
MNRNVSAGLRNAPARPRHAIWLLRQIRKSLISLVICMTPRGVYEVLILLGKDCGHNRPKQLLRVAGTAKADTHSNSLQHSNPLQR